MGIPVKFIATILLASIAAASCNTQATNTDKSTPADTSAAFHLSISRQQFWDSLPKYVGWTNDWENLFSDQQEKQLDSIITDFEKKTTVEIAIVTLDTSMVSKDKFDDLILHIHNTWGVGKKGKNNGIVIGISSGHRKIRINNGYGIEKVLSNEETKSIIDKDFTPFFRKGDFFGGTLNGLKSLMEKLNEKMNQSSVPGKKSSQH